MGRAVELIVAWVVVIGYIILGGAALREIELQEEVKQATDYCVKVEVSAYEETEYMCVFLIYIFVFAG